MDDYKSKRTNSVHIREQEQADRDPLALAGHDSGRKSTPAYSSEKFENEYLYYFPLKKTPPFYFSVTMCFVDFVF